MMNLQHWRLLVAVADLSSVSRAAEHVGITQSGASQAIAQLEAALGIQVFARERRQLCVTALGERVVEQARAMVSSFDAIRALASQGKGLASGRIRLASFPSVISTVLPPLVRAFQRRHPGIDVVALEGTDEEVEAWLLADTVDVGVVMNPLPQRRAAILGRDAWVGVVPASHRLGRRSSEGAVSLAELVAEPFILATGGCAVNAQSLAHEAGLRLPDVRVTVRDWVSACVLVREEMGVALVPESALPEDRRGLRIMRLAEPIQRVFGLVCSGAGTSSEAVQALMAGLREAPPPGTA